MDSIPITTRAALAIPPLPEDIIEHLFDEVNMGFVMPGGSPELPDLSQRDLVWVKSCKPLEPVLTRSIYTY